MIIKVIAVVVLVLLILGGMWGMMHDRRLAEAFPTINDKADEARVRSVMGDPNAIERPCKAYDTQLTTNCDHVFIYESSFAPLRRKYWLVFFDDKNQATATSAQVEP
jgi:hypothetical protein